MVDSIDTFRLGPPGAADPEIAPAVRLGASELAYQILWRGRLRMDALRRLSGSTRSTRRFF